MDHAKCARRKSDGVGGQVSGETEYGTKEDEGGKEMMANTSRKGYLFSVAAGISPWGTCSIGRQTDSAKEMQRWRGCS